MCKFSLILQHNLTLPSVLLFRLKKGKTQKVSDLMVGFVMCFFNSGNTENTFSNLISSTGSFTYKNFSNNLYCDSGSVFKKCITLSNCFII